MRYFKFCFESAGKVRGSRMSGETSKKQNLKSSKLQVESSWWQKINKKFQNKIYKNIFHLVKNKFIFCPKGDSKK